MRCLTRLVVVTGLLLGLGAGIAVAGGNSGQNQCDNSTCLAYCQGFCDSTRLRCKKTGSKARECRARGYRSCMNGCVWEICGMQPGSRPSYQCKRHPDL